MNILIVDDDIPTMDMIVSTIDWQAIGFRQVFTAYSIAPAKEILMENPVDLVISDIEMPRGSGLDLLKWIRDREMDTAFVLLTCHEKFEYAATAIKMDVMEYVVKPFDPDIMVVTLKRCASKIQRKQAEQESLDIGQWHRNNLYRNENAFWLSLLQSPDGVDITQLEAEITAQRLPVSVDGKYRLIVTRISDYEQQMEEMGKKLFSFFLKNLFGEVFFADERNRRTVFHYLEDELWIITPVEESDGLDRKCAEILSRIRQSLKLDATMCIGHLRQLAELAAGFISIQKLIGTHVAFYGRCFREDQPVFGGEDSQILDIAELDMLLLKGDKLKILLLIKNELDNRAITHKLGEHTLYTLRKELTQAVYAHMMKEGIPVTAVVGGETFDRLADNSCRSSLDFVRWANYLLEKTFQGMEDQNRSGNLVDRVNAFIAAHYQESLSRDQIAAAFHLTPQYLAKLYSKKTGRFLMDYLREYRIQQAKKLLAREDITVSEAAMQSGFDNFSYFSTLFKKETGMTPQQYRQSILQARTGRPAG